MSGCVVPMNDDIACSNVFKVELTSVSTDSTTAEWVISSVLALLPEVASLRSCCAKDVVS